MNNLTWTKQKPTMPGFYWAFDPPDVMSSAFFDGKVLLIEIERGGFDSSGLVGWVPYMDYADSLEDNTWDNVYWLGPVEVPTPPTIG